MATYPEMEKDDTTGRQTSLVEAIRPPSLPDMAAVPAGAILLPSSHVERPGVQKAVDDLINPENALAPYTIVGMGGAGKTVLASAVVRTQSVREHFRGGIFWMRVGTGAKNTLLPLLLGLAREIGAAPTGTTHFLPRIFDSLEQVRQHLAMVTATCTFPRLLVLDDVWERDVVDAFLPLGLKLLVTTRDRHVVGVPGGWLEVGDMAENEALELLLKTSTAESMTVGQLGDDVRTQMTKVVALCGHLPLGLVIAGSMSVVKGKGSTAGAWKELIKLFKNERNMMRARGEQGASIGLVVSASFDVLPERKQNAILKTAVLTASAVAPIEMLLNLWETQDRESTLEEAEGLVSKCLLQDLGGGRYRVHDTVLKFLKTQIKAESDLAERAAAQQAHYLGRLDVLKSYGNPEHGAGNQDLFVLDALWRSVEELSGDPQLEAATSYLTSLGELEPSEVATPHVASYYSSIGFLFDVQGKYSRAESLHKSAEEILEKCLGPNHPDVATALNSRAESLKSQGEYSNAESLCLRATGIFEKSLGLDHPKVASSLTSRAELLEAQNKLDEAELLYLRAITIQETSLGPEHPHLANSLLRWAKLLQTQNKLEEAELLNSRAIAIQEKALGPIHPSLADSLGGRAKLLYKQGKLAEAEPLVHRAMMIQETALGPEHPSLADSLVCWASLLQAQGKLEEAEPLYLRAIAIQEEALGPIHPSLADSLGGRARLLQQQTKHAEAESLYQRATRIFERSLGRDHPKVVSSLTSRVELLETQGKNLQAGQLRERIRAINAKVKSRGFYFVNEENLFAKEAPSGVDRLDYDVYAAALAGLFSTGETDVLPAAVGIYAPWGAGKSFLLHHLKSRLQASDSRPSRCTTWCCCLGGLKRMILHNVVLVIAWAILKMLWAWLCSGYEACRSPNVSERTPSDHEVGQEEGANCGTEFIVIEFNAWECAGLEILWAVVTTKIFDAVEKHTAFGRGAVRAARIKAVLEDPGWNWCGLATFYLTVALLGTVVVLVLNETGALDGLNRVARDLPWIVATLLLPGGLSLLNILIQMSSRGSLRTAQSALRKAVSKRESVGDAYLGFMSEVKEELEILFDMVNTHNQQVRRKHAEESKQNEDAEPNLGAKLKAKSKTLALAVIVDDLDRCSKEKIMAMLKATHLLLEQPKAPMAVFLAVDPQLIVSAIAESLEGQPSTIKALQYLDKIIHLPFCLPTLSAPKRLNMLDSLLNGSDNSCQKTLQRVKKFLKHDAPSEDDLQVSERLVSEWYTGPDTLLGKAELELVSILQWWSQPGSAALRWREKLEYALESLRAMIGEASEAAWETRRAACLKLLEALCETINMLMIIQPEESSQAKYTAITLNRVKKFLRRDARRGVYQASEMPINEWYPTFLLDEVELELVSTLHTWSKAGSVSPRWRDKLEDALEPLRTVLGGDADAAWETRRVACLKPLEALCGTINMLMSTQTEGFSQAENTGSTSSRAESFSTVSSTSAGEGAAPVSDRGVLPGGGHRAPVSRPPSRTGGEGGEVGSGEFKAAAGDGVVRTEFSVPTRDGPHCTSHSPDGPRGNPSGNNAAGRTLTSEPAAAPSQTFNRAISKDENEAFRALFKVVHATPRKIKRVVNVYFLHRSVAKNTDWWERKDSKTREKELVTWTILAEFWPFRLSCIAFAMTNDAPEGKPRQLEYTDNPTIASVYGDSAGDPSKSVCKWIANYRGRGTPKDLFLCDDAEGRFQAAMKAGAQITKDTVENCLMHSLNLNPAVMSTIEVEMVYDLPETAESRLADTMCSLWAEAVESRLPDAVRRLLPEIK